MFTFAYAIAVPSVCRLSVTLVRPTQLVFAIFLRRLVPWPFTEGARTLQTDDRQTTDGTAIAYSEREHKLLVICYSMFVCLLSYLHLPITVLTV